MAETNTRQASRAPVTLKIKFKSETLDQFIERYSVDISHGGIFIRTKDPLAVGTALKFEFQLKDASPLITGEGTVVWTREPDAKRAGVSPGMGVRFDKLPSESQKVLDQVLAKKGGKLSSEVEPVEDDEDDDAAGDFVDSPTRVAPAGLVDSLVGGNQYEDSDLTPLPKPMPFHGDVDDFSDDAFNESTKVASLDQILAQAKGSEESEESAYDEDAVFASTSAPKSAPAEEEQEAATADASYEDPFAELNEGLEDEAPKRPDSERVDTRAETEVHTAKAVLAAEEDELDGAPEDEAGASSAADDDDDDDDSELDDDDDGTDNDDDDDDDEAAASKLGTARAAVLDPTVDEERGSSMPWIAVAAVILLIGGAGGFWLLNKNKEKKTIPAAGAQTQELADPPKLPESAISDPIKEPEPPAVPTKSVAIATIPEGATVSVEGTELRATSPATFDLEEGKSVAILVQHDSYLSQRIELVADGSELKPIKLVPKARLLRISSQPPGAIVTVNGQRLRGRTPLDLPVSKRMAAMDSVRVQLRMPGYEAAEGKIAMNEGFEASETELVSKFSSTLNELARPKVNNTRPPKTDPDNGGANTKVDAGSGTGTKVDPKSDPTKDPGKTDPGKTDPVKADPVKADPDPGKADPAKPDPAKKDPVKKDPPKADSSAAEPTPDWMK